MRRVSRLLTRGGVLKPGVQRNMARSRLFHSCFGASSLFEEIELVASIPLFPRLINWRPVCSRKSRPVKEYVP